MRKLAVHLARVRVAVASCTLWFAVPGLVAVAVSPDVAEAKSKKKKKKRDRTQQEKTKQDADFGEKKSYGAPEVVKEQEREKIEVEEKPTLTSADFARTKELQRKEKIDEQLRLLKEIIAAEPDKEEMPQLMFREGELNLEQSDFFFFEGMGLDDAIVLARDGNKKQQQKKLEAKKKVLLKASSDSRREGMEIYAKMIRKYPKYERLGDVVYALAQAHWDINERDKAISYYRKLITEFPKSQFIPDAWLNFGEYYFFKADIKRALEAYERTAAFEESKVFGYAIYKQGWCYYNKGDFDTASEKFKEVVLYSELSPELLGDRKITLGREARKDYVLAYSHRIGTNHAQRAYKDFEALASNPEEHRKMIERLADIYFGEGKDHEAIIIYKTLMATDQDNTRNPFFQARIVTCAKRLNDKRFVVKMARQLVKEFQRVRTYATQHANDPKVNKERLEGDLQDAEDLADNTLRSLATTWHNEARKTKDEDTFEMAYELYGDYLELFPDKKPAYEIRFFYAELLFHLERFEKAGAEYTKVLMKDPEKGKWAKASAEEAVRAFDEAVQDYDQANKRPPLKGEAALKPLPVPKIKKQLLAAANNYLKYYPDGDIAVECKYKIAKTLYDYNNFDQAAERFLLITKEHPESSRAEEAANLTLDVYNLRQEWRNLNEAARGFTKNQTLMKNENFKKAIGEILENSSFKLIRDYEQDKDYATAAKKYLTFVDEFPKSELADKAMVNAAINLLKSGQPEESIQVRKRFVDKYPKSPLVPDSMYAIAESYEQVIDYKSAAEWLEKFVKIYPKDERSKDAMFNASIYREGLGDYKKAIENREAYIKSFPKAEDLSTMQLSIARVYKLMGNTKKASEAYLGWSKKYSKNKDQEFDARFKAVDVLRSNRRSRSAGDSLERTIVRDYEKLGRKAPSKFKNETNAQARIRFLLSDEAFAEYKKQKIEYPRSLSGQALKTFQKTLKKKVDGKDKVKGIYTEVVKLGRPEWAIASLYRIGEAHIHLVDAIVKTPAPQGLTREQAFLFKEKLTERTYPIEEQAAEAFKLCVDKSVELNLFNQWTQQCLNFLEDKRPDAYPAIIEELAEVDVSAPLPPAQPLVTSLSSKEEPTEIKSTAAPDAKDSGEAKAGSGGAQ